MEHRRPHLDRAAGDVEVGVYDATADRGYTAKHAAPHAQAPAFLRNWARSHLSPSEHEADIHGVKQENRRPVWLVELVAEFWGVFLYTFLGVGATAAFTTSNAAKLVGYGGVLNVAIAYALGIVFAVTMAGPVSGGHLSPAYTIAFTIFKGFPLRKAPQYILAQILGGYIAVLCVYGQYKQEIDAVTEGIRAAAPNAIVANAEIFSPFGSAGILAIYPTPGQILRYVFLNELVVTMMLAIIVFTVIDPTNAFVSISTGAWIIGAAYLAMIVAFSGATVALNTARDFGGRLAAATIFGRIAFDHNKSYVALAALTNVLGTVIGAFIQVFWLSDHRRPVLMQNPGSAASHAAAPSPDGTVNGSTNGLGDKGRYNDSTLEHREFRS